MFGQILLVAVLFIQLTTATINKIQIPSLDVQYIVERLETEDKMSKEEAMNTVNELAHYYTALKDGINGSPSGMVDKAWHAHILNTPMYMEFTQAEFGRYLHHLPYWSGHSSDGTEADIYTHLTTHLGIEQVNATIWNREENEPFRVTINGGLRGLGRCVGKCKTCRECHSR